MIQSYIYMFLYFEINKGKKVIIYLILAAYTRRCLANVNVKHYRNYSKFGLVVPLISFWQPKQLPVSVANTKPHTATSS